MAEGWVRHLKTDEVEVFSAGIEKHGLNPYAVEVMAEAGVDISKQESTIIDELDRIEFDWIITLCGHAEATCPHLPGIMIHRGFDDPPKLAAELSSESQRLVPYRRVRDEIRDYITTLLQSLKP